MVPPINFKGGGGVPGIGLLRQRRVEFSQRVVVHAQRQISFRRLQAFSNFHLVHS